MEPSFFELLVVYSSLAAGVSSASFTILSFLRARHFRESKLREAKEQRFLDVLESDNLVEVGNYLDETIGNFNLYEYVSNPRVSKTVDKYLEKLRFFVGTDAELTQQIKETETPPKIEPRPILTDEFSRVLTDLRAGGEIWNALARLRRHIEITLREIAKSKNIRLEKPSSAGNLLNVLLRNKVIPQDAFLNIKYAITVCNKGVHGIEVSMDEAEEAVLHADIGLRRLN